MKIKVPLMKWLAGLYKHHTQYVSDNLNLKQSETDILRYLYYEGDGVNQKLLEHKLGLDKATISRAVKTLLEKNFLKRKKSELDGRVYLIYLTQKGKEFEAEFREVYDSWFNLFLSDIEENELEIILKNFKKMYKIIQKENT